MESGGLLRVSAEASEIVIPMHDLSGSEGLRTVMIPVLCLAFEDDGQVVEYAISALKD